MWSLGLILHSLCFSALPFDAEDDYTLLAELILASPDVPRPRAPAPRSSALLDLLSSCLARAPEARPSASAVLAAPLLAPLAARRSTLASVSSPPAAAAPAAERETEGMGAGRQPQSLALIPRPPSTLALTGPSASRTQKQIEPNGAGR